MNYAFEALWGAWLLFGLASARGNKQAATPTGLRWRFTALAAILIVLLGSRQFPEYFQHRLLPPSAAWMPVPARAPSAEEALLTRQFPDAYLRHQRRVTAIIPFLS